MKYWSFVLATIFCALLVTPQAHAQSCPPGLADPLQLLDRTVWAFHTEAADFSEPGMASIGIMKLTFVPAGADPKNPYPHGNLSVVETVNDRGRVTREASASGRYTVAANCSGGTLMFMLNEQPIQFEFVFANGFRELRMLATRFVPDLCRPRVVNDDNSDFRLTIPQGPMWIDCQGTTRLYVGKAVPAPPQTCPAGLANPLQLIDGQTWTYQAYSAARVFRGSARIGIFKPKYVPAAIPRGDLSIYESLVEGPAVRPNGTIGATISGRYQVSPNCNGGVLMIMSHQQQIQFEFIFTATGEMFLLSDSITHSWPDVVSGIAKMY